MDSELLAHLAIFAAAAERGNFTAAARDYGLSQAAVSQHIRQLEALLRTQLFRREGGRVALTDAGRRLHGYARRILDLVAEARQDLTGTPGEIAGQLLIAASSVPGQHLLPHALAMFRKQHPCVEVRVSVADTDAALRQVEQGQASLAMVGGPGGGPHLEFRRVASDELVVVVPKRHPWWRKRHISAADLIGQPLIQRERGSATRRCFEQSLANGGTAASALNVVLELGNTEAIRGAVIEGVGVAVMSRMAVRNEVKAGTLKTLRVDGLALDRDISIVRDRRRVLSSPARHFLALMTAGAEPSL